MPEQNELANLFPFHIYDFFSKRQFSCNNYMKNTCYVFHQEFQLPRNWWKYEATGQQGRRSRGGLGGTLAPPLLRRMTFFFCFCFSICLFHALSRLIISRSISDGMPPDPPTNSRLRRSFSAPRLRNTLRRPWPSAFVSSRCLEPLMKHEARIFDKTSQTKQTKICVLDSGGLFKDYDLQKVALLSTSTEKWI